ncbi:glycosyltransferase family 4 protein [Phormidesmis sp. 146-12]
MDRSASNALAKSPTNSPLPHPETPIESDIANLKVAWVFPSLALGSYWHPVFTQFTKRIKQTKIFTGVWTGFAPGFENAFTVEIVGETKFIPTEADTGQYVRNITVASPRIVPQLLRFRPDVIFASGFSMWTLLILLLKPIAGWRVIIAYEGCSPAFDFLDDPIRLFFRRRMIQFTDAYITNSDAGQTYLIDVLKTPPERVFARPYEVPDAQALLGRVKEREPDSFKDASRPVFLFVGQLIRRKGLHLLLEACAVLRAWGYQDYTLVVVGDGCDRDELEILSRNRELDNVRWEGWVAYDELGSYFCNADVFILPTLEDTWGMVVLESMVFGKPILCSNCAGAAEMVADGENGYVIDPNDPEALAERMSRFIKDPNLAPTMGARSQQIIESYEPEGVAQFLTQVVEFAHKGR